MKLWYHGTDHDFTVFDKQHIGRSTGCLSPGFWFHELPEGARFFGDILLTVQLRPHLVQVVTRNQFIKRGRGPTNWAWKAATQDYDAVIIRDIVDGMFRGTVICVMDLRCVKIVEVDKQINVLSTLGGDPQYVEQ